MVIFWPPKTVEILSWEGEEIMELPVLLLFVSNMILAPRIEAKIATEVLSTGWLTEKLPMSKVVNLRPTETTPSPSNKTSIPFQVPETCRVYHSFGHPEKALTRSRHRILPQKL